MSVGCVGAISVVQQGLVDRARIGWHSVGGEGSVVWLRWPYARTMTAWCPGLVDRLRMGWHAVSVVIGVWVGCGDHVRIRGSWIGLG